jgi:hypothetical protein
LASWFTERLQPRTMCDPTSERPARAIKNRRQTIAGKKLSAFRYNLGRSPHFVLCKSKRLCYTLRAREVLYRVFLGSSAVEHSTVNRMVAGSNPARGATCHSRGWLRDPQTCDPPPLALMKPFPALTRLGSFAGRSQSAQVTLSKGPLSARVWRRSWCRASPQSDGAFHGAHHIGILLSTSALQLTLRGLGYQDVRCPRGFRSIASTLLKIQLTTKTLGAQIDQRISAQSRYGWIVLLDLAPRATSFEMSNLHRVSLLAQSGNRLGFAYGSVR